MTKKEREKQEAIERIKTHLEVSEKEALKVWEYDNAIDTDKTCKLGLLSKAQQEVVKKMTATGTRTKKDPTIYQFKQRERKPNATKGGLIAEFAEFLAKNSGFAVENVQILNAERQISFKIGENTFELTLTQKRKPKK